MKIKVVQIGNSKGIRIPKVILRQTGIHEEVNLEVKENQIIIEPTKYTVRSGWNSAFAKMAEIGDDKLLDQQSLINQSSFDESDWEW